MTHSWLHGDSCHCRHYALICLSSFPSLFLLSHTLVFSWAASLPPPPSLPTGSRLRGAETAKTHFLELVFTSFSFCGTSCAASVIRPVRADSLGETSWCTDSWGDNSLFLLLSGIFFYLSLSVSRGLLSPLYCFSIYFAGLQVYFDMKQSKSDPPEMDHLLEKQTSAAGHHRKMSRTDITQHNDIRPRHKKQFVPADLQYRGRLPHPLQMITSPSNPPSPLAASGGMQWVWVCGPW